MSQENIKQILKGLHDEIQKLEKIDDTSKNRLDDLVVNLEKQLENTKDNIASEDILESISHLIEQLEIEHPNLTAILSKLSMTLSNMGI